MLGFPQVRRHDFPIKFICNPDLEANLGSTRLDLYLKRGLSEDQEVAPGRVFM